MSKRATKPATATRITTRMRPKTRAKKPTYGIPFVIASPSGERLIECLVLIVPDGHATDLSKPLPVLPESLRIGRTRWAGMVRGWRNDPGTPRDRRNFPTVSEILMACIRRQLFAAFMEGGAS